jgi:hypothetical protein
MRKYPMELLLRDDGSRKRLEILAKLFHHGTRAVSGSP